MSNEVRMAEHAIRNIGAREVRKVPTGWEHPKGPDGKLVPLFYGYRDAVDRFRAVALELGEDAALQHFGVYPNRADYMDSEWGEDLDLPMYMMYENTTEGTPISTPFETPEKLARWLTDTRASAHGSITGDYEWWLSKCKTGE